jgi:sigma-54 dependent transcriptional regulator, acetoin dehydrogenase operon transcriptional activator AcoR
MNGTAGATNDPATDTSGKPPDRIRPSGLACPDGVSRRPESATLTAWERFVGGEDTVQGVRPEILASWHRCRDQYRVDPRRAQAPPEPGDEAGGAEASPVHGMVFTELGGAAALAASEAESVGGLITVADSGGRILASWGDRKALGLAAERVLAPWSAWPERTAGTNGMGTALQSRHPVTVLGAEHWCQVFHDRACAGVAVRDAATEAAIAVLNVSLRGVVIPAGLSAWLRNSTAGVQASLRERERASGTELVAAFARAAAGAAGPVAALDMAGRVVIANDEAALLLGVPSQTPAVNPASRWAAEAPEIAAVARQAARQARIEPGWTGTARIYVPFTQALLPLTVTPVFQARQVIGMLVSGGGAGAGAAGEPLEAADPLALIPAGPPALISAPAPAAPARPGLPGQLPGRVIARRDESLVVLAMPEIRYAEAAGNIVWLATDQGRLRATAHGLDHLERDLSGYGFLRVHRRYLVNLRRVREIDLGFKGSLFLVTDVRQRESIPVSRRHAPALRRALGV